MQSETYERGLDGYYYVTYNYGNGFSCKSLINFDVKVLIPGNQKFIELGIKIIKECENSIIPKIKNDRVFEIYTPGGITVDSNPGIVDIGIKFLKGDRIMSFKLIQLKELLLKGIHCELVEEDENQIFIMWCDNGVFDFKKGDHICDLAVTCDSYLLKN